MKKKRLGFKFVLIFQAIYLRSIHFMLHVKLVRFLNLDTFFFTFPPRAVHRIVFQVFFFKYYFLKFLINFYVFILNPSPPTYFLLFLFAFIYLSSSHVFCFIFSLSHLFFELFVVSLKKLIHWNQCKRIWRNHKRQ